jgi:hypothetical protein
MTRDEILSNPKLTDMEKLQLMFDIDKEWLRKHNSALYYCILAVLDKEKKPDPSGYFG